MTITLAITLAFVWLAGSAYLSQFVGDRPGDLDWEVAAFWPVIIPLAVMHQ